MKPVLVEQVSAERMESQAGDVLCSKSCPVDKPSIEGIEVAVVASNQKLLVRVHGRRFETLGD